MDEITKSIIHYEFEKIKNKIGDTFSFYGEPINIDDNIETLVVAVYYMAINEMNQWIATH